MKACTICPRKCGVDRIGQRGYCKAPHDPVVATVMAHRGEESVISGSKGSGTVFFSGCNLSCVFCQNYDISQECRNRPTTPSELANMFMILESQGVHNINLVTPSHYVPQIAEAIKRAKDKGITIPFVYNSNGYDALPSLEIMDGLIDIYMPDLKYANDTLGQKYSNVSDYFTVASKALPEMQRQVGEPVVKNGIMQKGVLIRHLVIPGLIDDTKEVLDWIKSNLPFSLVNLMDQYRPEYRAYEHKEINRRLTSHEYQTVVAHFDELKLREV